MKTIGPSIAERKEALNQFVESIDSVTDKEDLIVFGQSKRILYTFLQKKELDWFDRLVGLKFPTNHNIRQNISLKKERMVQNKNIDLEKPDDGCTLDVAQIKDLMKNSKVCAISGYPLLHFSAHSFTKLTEMGFFDDESEYRGGKYSKFAWTIDRKDSSLPYAIENVEVVSDYFNGLKSNLDIFSLSCLISEIENLNASLEKQDYLTDSEIGRLRNLAFKNFSDNFPGKPVRRSLFRGNSSIKDLRLILNHMKREAKMGP